MYQSETGKAKAYREESAVAFFKWYAIRLEPPVLTALTCALCTPGASGDSRVHHD
jgi:hypothetical protein